MSPLLSINTRIILLLLSLTHLVLAKGADPTPVTDPLPSSTYPTCLTITSTNAPPCPTPIDCTSAACLLLSTITLQCGCPSIYTKNVCASTCTLGYGTTYKTLYLPCAMTSLPHTNTTGTVMGSGSVSGSGTLINTTPTATLTTTTMTTPTTTLTKTPTSSPSCPSTTTPSSTPITSTSTSTSTMPITTITITTTDLLTITSCPTSIKCHGQTSTWTSTFGPFSCATSTTCSCVLGTGSTSSMGMGMGSGGRWNTTTSPVSVLTGMTSSGPESVVVGGGSSTPSPSMPASVPASVPPTSSSASSSTSNAASPKPSPTLVQANTASSTLPNGLLSGMGFYLYSFLSGALFLLDIVL